MTRRSSLPLPYLSVQNGRIVVLMEAGQKAPLGRPRGFDTEDALEHAMCVFWQHGYEGASLADLTSAMGINRTSMYAAFGNKEELFVRAFQRYTDGPASYGLNALQAPTALRVAAAILEGSVATSTRPGYPAGCLGVQGSLAAGPSAVKVREMLSQWRNMAVARLSERFQRAIDEEDLPPHTNPGVLARYVITVSNGIAVQAASGADPDELRQVAAAALRNWPSP